MSPGELVTVWFADHGFKCTRRTEAHLRWTADELERRYPGKRIGIIQTCYNTGVAASAGTHDFDAVFDFNDLGLGWEAAQRFLRECGWAAWWRKPSQGFSDHIHAVSLGYPGKVGIYVPGQVDDYYHHAYGLKGQHALNGDPSWFPPNINATVFDYEAWLGDQMTPDDRKWLEEQFKAIGDKLTNFDPKLDLKDGKAKRSLGAVLGDILGKVRSDRTD